MLYVNNEKVSYVLTIMGAVATAHPELDVNIESEVCFYDPTIMQYKVNFSDMRTGEIYASATIFIDDAEIPMTPDEAHWNFFSEFGRALMTPIFTHELANKFAWLTVR